mgnify:CR=1 FL=1
MSVSNHYRSLRQLSVREWAVFRKLSEMGLRVSCLIQVMKKISRVKLINFSLRIISMRPYVPTHAKGSWIPLKPVL